MGFFLIDSAILSALFVCFYWKEYYTQLKKGKVNKMLLIFFQK